MAKKKQLEYFEDKYGIKTLKTPISENDKALLKQIQESIDKPGMFIPGGTVMNKEQALF